MLKQISKNVFIMPHNDNTDRPVLGLIVGNDFSLVVDAGNSPKHAMEFLQEVKNIKVSPVKYLIITHWHWDHIFGISEMNLTSISSNKTQKMLIKLRKLSWDNYSLDKRVKQGQEIEFCSENIKKEMNNVFRSTFKSSLINISFNNKLEINLGGITCYIEKIGGCHSSDSTIIYVKEEKLMFMGDCMSEDYYSGPLSYDYAKYKNMIRKIEKYDTNLYVESHKEPQNKKDFWTKVSKIRSIGKEVGDEMDYDFCLKKYKQKYKIEPCEFDMYLIKSFIKGNKKRYRTI